MSDVESNLMLIDNEHVVLTLQREMSANAGGNGFFAKLKKWFDKIRGVRYLGMLTITNRRLVFEYQKKVFWCVDSEASHTTLLPHSISSVESSFAATKCMCYARQYMFSFTTCAGKTYTFGNLDETQAKEITNAALNALLKK